MLLQVADMLEAASALGLFEDSLEGSQLPGRSGTTSWGSDLALGHWVDSLLSGCKVWLHDVPLVHSRVHDLRACLQSRPSPIIVGISILSWAPAEQHTDGHHRSMPLGCSMSRRRPSCTRSLRSGPHLAKISWLSVKPSTPVVTPQPTAPGSLEQCGRFRQRTLGRRAVPGPCCWRLCSCHALRARA